MNEEIKPGGPAILVVDDEPSVGMLVAQFLRGEGCNPSVFHRPGDVLAAFETAPFRLAFIDINLPDMTGLELAALLKERDPLLEVVFMTGHGTFDNAIQAIKIGAYDYLMKPFGKNELSLCFKRFQEREALREQTRLAEKRYSDLVQNIPSLVLVIGKDLCVEFVNNACIGMLGFTPEEAMTDPTWFLGRIHSQEAERVKSLLVDAFESRIARFSAECRLRHKDGHSVHVLGTCIPLAGAGEDGEVERVQILIVDITDRVFTERAAVQEEKMKVLDSISSEVAHEIRNPLVSIGGFARRLRKRFPDLREGDIILQEAGRLEELVSRITAYLKPVDVNYQECSVNEVVQEALALITRDKDHQGLKHTLDLEKSLPDILIDRDLLIRIFASILKNAAGKMVGGASLEIKSFASHDNIHTEIRVRYAGEKAGVCEPFFMPFDEGGHMMGLPLSNRLLKYMGGILSFAQEEENMVFTVSIPKRVGPGG
jgi:two-component system, NtrC family, sensor histidine kinase HydH